MYLRVVFAVMAAALVIFTGCSESIDPVGPKQMPDLTGFAEVRPDSIPVGHGAGLYACIQGAVEPIEESGWFYQDQKVTDLDSATFVPQDSGTYEFEYFVRDGAGRELSFEAILTAYPLEMAIDTVIDSISLPPDTVEVQLPPDTVVVETPPDTVFVQLPPDTVEVVRVDSVEVVHVDTVQVVRTDTLEIIQIDSVEIEVPVPGDTVYQDTCFNADPCKLFGKSVHMVWWSIDGHLIKVTSKPAHAYGHEAIICAYLENGAVRMTVDRDKVKPGMKLTVKIDGQEHDWDVGEDDFAERIFNL